MPTSKEMQMTTPEGSGKTAMMEMNQIVLPQHSNALGSVFGGTIMSWIDICAAMAAQRHSRSVVVTASMDQLDFLAPIKVGDVVNMRATINYVGRTSMEVGVRVESEDMLSGERTHTASAYLTFVALGEDGKAKPVPPIVPQTAEEKLRFREAQARRAQRLQFAEQRKIMADQAREEEVGA